MGAPLPDDGRRLAGHPRFGPGGHNHPGPGHTRLDSTVPASGAAWLGRPTGSGPGLAATSAVPATASVRDSLTGQVLWTIRSARVTPSMCLRLCRG